MGDDGSLAITGRDTHRQTFPPRVIGEAHDREHQGRSRRLWFRHSFIPFIRLFEGTTPLGGVST
jgi:hypothetical protein